MCYNFRKYYALIHNKALYSYEFFTVMNLNFTSRIVTCRSALYSTNCRSIFFLSVFFKNRTSLKKVRTLQPSIKSLTIFQRHNRRCIEYEVLQNIDLDNTYGCICTYGFGKYEELIRITPRRKRKRPYQKIW